jgi:hypothetical protein
LIVDGRPGGRRRAAALLAAAVVTLAPWHLWLHAASGSWLPAGLSANLLHGAYSHGGPPDPVTFHALERRAADAGRGILGEATHLIAADPMGWVVRRARNVAGALAQPHGTSDLGGPSVRAALGDWVRGNRSTSELRPIVTTWGFAIRVIVYLFHYAGLALAVAGLSLTRRDWRTWLPLWIAIAYVVGLHAVLTASPRYLFLIQPFVWVLAAAALSVAAGWFFQPVLSYNRR